MTDDPMQTAIPSHDRAHAACFLVAIASGAFLLFQIQPLIGKAILPWFGGSSSVWTSCMLFFQTALLAGYAYAHLIGNRGTPRAQLLVHALLLLAGLAFLPVLPAVAWKPDGPDGAIVRILALLAATVGLPYLMLASTGPLVQSWFARRFPGRAPYRLYAVSNAASLAALVSYPFLVEPRLELRAQALLWSAGYVVFAVASGGCAWIVLRAGRSTGHLPAASEEPAVDRAPRSAVSAALLWVAPAACGVALFLAVTNQLCLNLANVPFLWILPLTLYLVSFIVAFAGEAWYQRRVLLPLFVVAVGTIAATITGKLELPGGESLDLSLSTVIALHSAALLVLCLVLHGELYRLRPAASRLTAYYLAISAGGALGGVFVGVVAPLVFILYQELQLGLLAACVTVAALVWRDRRTATPATGRRLLAAAAAVAWVGLAVWFVAQRASLLETAVWTDRNFYGTTRVLEVGSVRAVMHGSTVHGAQETSERGRRIATTYYTAQTAPALIVGERHERGPLVVGVVGLGAGTLAAYCEPGDRIRFYELDPNMIRVAREWFNFVGDCEARGGRVEIVPGDARLSIERELSDDAAPRYDLLVLDAFSSDAIPVHLLTAEAFALYERVVAADGAIAVHVTNRHLDLRGVVARSAGSIGFDALHTATPGGGAARRADWVVTARPPVLAAFRSLRGRGAPLGADDAPRWTDRSSDLFSVLR